MLEEFELAEDAEKLAKTAGIEYRGDEAFLDDETIKELPLKTSMQAQAQMNAQIFL